MLLLLTLLSTPILVSCEQSSPEGNVQAQSAFNIGGSKPWSTLQAEVDQAKDGDTIDLSSYVYPVPQGTSCNVTVPKGLSLKLQGRGWVFEKVSFFFEGDNTVVIEDLGLTYNFDEPGSGEPPPSALYFQGGDNHLELVGNNSVFMNSREDMLGYGAAIGVPKGSSLLIDGDGSLKVNSGSGGGAGIGGGFNTASGKITISGGDITVFGGVANAYKGLSEQQKGAAAIGGGSGADGGEIIITGGRILARGNGGAAGIGGGFGGTGGIIQISGGYVESHADEGAAGIGGGLGGAGGIIRIDGGEVEAYSVVSGDSPGSGPAIGNGYGGTGGILAMSGGILIAIGSGLPCHTAIDCTIRSLPVQYHWRADALDDPDGQGIQESSYPDQAFVNSSNYSFVRIEAY
ncbi:MAG: hypothetical protein LBU61_00440 [Coriobacteriales bacterium]|jgi:hypothetical protein|nr:hypothetical protein [Coriobacteriales bacterium]